MILLIIHNNIGEQDFKEDRQGLQLALDNLVQKKNLE